MPTVPPSNPDLLCAVVAAPRDPAPRLAYADWLDGRGWREWADCIRHPMDWFPCDYHRPVRGFMAAVRAWAGIPAHITLSQHDRPEWWASMRHHARPFRYVEVFTDRGFVEAVNCTSKFWLRYGPALVASQPIDAVAVNDPPRSPARRKKGTPPPAEVRECPLSWARTAAGMPATVPVTPATHTTAAAAAPTPAVPEPAPLAF